MAYPEVIPPLSPKEGTEFLKRLRAFGLTNAQRDFWADPSATQVSEHEKKK